MCKSLDAIKLETETMHNSELQNLGKAEGKKEIN